MTDQRSTVDIVIDELARITGSDAGEIHPDTDLLQPHLLTSLNLISLVTWIEDEHELVIDPMDIVVENFERPEVIAHYVDGLRSST